jgi:hypothetical protein
LVVDIYEPSVGYDYPVVRHEFVGRTREEAQGYHDAHLHTCTFFRQCIEQGDFDGLKCETNTWWKTVG